jgi:drug/metabolite transporter (DMT)-like permease
MTLSRFASYAVALIFVASGSVSTISSKWMDDIKAVGRSCSDANDPANCKTDQEHLFDHPFVQTWFMFLGEFVCMIIIQGTILYKRYNVIPLSEGVDYMKPVTPFIFMIPALCDFTASTTMYVGLTLTAASVYQMLRGATVLFTGILSIIFLKRRFRSFEWLGMVLVTSGLLCVGIASTLFSHGKSSGTNPVLGDILIFGAQLIVSGQMVIEEKILTKYNVPPMLLVGWEGTFGLFYASTALGIFQAWPKNGPSLNGHNPPDDFLDATAQMGNDYRLVVSNLLCVFAITFLNAAGQTITKNISATARMVLDTVRNVIVWGFCLAIPFFDEKFEWLQLVGFICLVCGNAIFKQIIKLPCEFFSPPPAEESNEAATVAGEDDDYLANAARKPLLVNGTNSNLSRNSDY